jgi:hypothetical protein
VGVTLRRLKRKETLYQVLGQTIKFTEGSLRSRASSFPPGKQGPAILGASTAASFAEVNGEAGGSVDTIPGSSECRLGKHNLEQNVGRSSVSTFNLIFRKPRRVPTHPPTTINLRPVSAVRPLLVLRYHRQLASTANLPPPPSVRSDHHSLSLPPVLHQSIDLEGIGNTLRLSSPHPPPIIHHPPPTTRRPSPITHHLLFCQVLKSSLYIDTMNRITRGHLNIAGGRMAIGSAASSYAINAISRLKSIGGDPVAKASTTLRHKGRDSASAPSGSKEANACTRARGHRKARHQQLTTSSTVFRSANRRQ